MVTINLAWESEEESAQWVEYCNGPADSEYGKMRAERGHPEPYNVRFWSLGNEMGYGHMEGPKDPKSYTEYALRHAEAMLKVTPNLELFASGPYPNDTWAKESAAEMADKVPYISLHQYLLPPGGVHYTTPETVKKTYEGTIENVFAVRKHAETMRKSLDATGKNLNISFDEWNQWYSWYRPPCIGEGIFTARVLHLFLNESNGLRMPVCCYFQPVNEGAILVGRTESRLTPNGQMFAMMKAHQDGKICHVDENEDLSTAATVHGDTLVITLINEKFDEERTFSFDIRGKVIEARVYEAEDVLPWSYFEEKTLEVTNQKKKIQATLPAHSAALIRVKTS
jgi:alpha-N-arabinofuranosidase